MQMLVHRVEGCARRLLLLLLAMTYSVGHGQHAEQSRPSPSPSLSQPVADVTTSASSLLIASDLTYQELSASEAILTLRACLQQAGLTRRNYTGLQTDWAGQLLVDRQAKVVHHSC